MDCPFLKKRLQLHPSTDCIYFEKVNPFLKWLFTTIGVTAGIGVPALKSDIYVQMMDAGASLKYGAISSSVLVCFLAAVAALVVVGRAKHRTEIEYLFHGWGYPTFVLAALGLATLNW